MWGRQLGGGKKKRPPSIYVVGQVQPSRLTAKKRLEVNDFVYFAWKGDTTSQRDRRATTHGGRRAQRASDLGGRGASPAPGRVQPGDPKAGKGLVADSRLAVGLNCRDGVPTVRRKAVVTRSSSVSCGAPSTQRCPTGEGAKWCRKLWSSPNNAHGKLLGIELA